MNKLAQCAIRDPWLKEMSAVDLGVRYSATEIVDGEDGTSEGDEYTLADAAVDYENKSEAEM